MKFFIVWEHYSNQWTLLEKGYNFLEIANSSLIDIELGEYLERLAEIKNTNKKFLVPIQCQPMPKPREKIEQPQAPEQTSDELDPLYDQAVAFVVGKQRASIAGVQRQFRIGFNRAAIILEQMESNGIISEPDQNGNREVLYLTEPKF